MQIWLLWFRNRWQGIGAAVIATLALLLIALVLWGGPAFGVRLLGNVDAPRAVAALGPSGTVLPRSGDPNADPPVLADANASILDTPAPADTGPQTVAEAQAAWRPDAIAARQQALLASFNCARQQQKLPAMTLDAQLSQTAGTAWLRLAHDPSFSLMNLPDQYQWRSIMPLPSGMQATAGAPGQAVSTVSSNAALCSAAAFDMSIVPAASVATRIGIAVFPPQASWDMASAVILVQ
jgi:hypothetical protein